MSGDDENDKPDTAGEYTQPSQIPLLDDVVSEGKPVRRRRRKTREEKNLEIDLNPEPPETGDLFDDLDASTTPTDESARRDLTDDLSAVDSTEDAATPSQAGHSLRSQADAVVDRLVKEYARDMIHRLRDELTQLLDELDEDGRPVPSAQPEKVWDGPPLSAWHPWLPVEVARRLEGTSANWAVVGGWAIDLFLRAHTRDHDDIEIAVPRNEWPLLLPFVADCELFQVGDGEVCRMRPPDPVPDSVHQIWIVEPATGHYRLDIMLEPGNEETWVYRRDESLQVPRAEVTMRRNHIPFLSPEIVLLFKARAGRDKDQADFDRCLPHLTSDRRMWLRGSLERFFPDSVWLRSL